MSGVNKRTFLGGLVLVTLSAICMLFGESSAFEKHCTWQQTEEVARGTCGAALRGVLSLVCNNRFKDIHSKHPDMKRSHKGQLPSEEQNILPAGEFILGGELESKYQPFRSRTEALNTIRSKRGIVRSDDQGPVCECCVHGCSQNEIKEYCASP